MTTYEINKRLLAEQFHNNPFQAIAAGYAVEWTEERIKAAFNFGHGSYPHFIVYMNANKKHNAYYCVD